MWAPICQVGKWKGLYGEVDITHEKLDAWVEAFGRDEKIPVTFGHRTDPRYAETTGEPSACWIGGLMKAGDLLLGNYVDWTPEGADAIMNHRYKNVSIESEDGSRLNSVALLGARDPAVKFHNDKSRFLPLDMAGECLGEAGQILLAQNLEEVGGAISLPQGQWQPPDAGDAPKEVKDILRKAYAGCRDKNPAETPEAKAKCAKIAWGAVENAGWKQDAKDKWVKSKQAATAANQGGRMSFKEKAIAALKDVAAKLEGEPEEPVTPAPPAPVAAAAPPVAEPAKDAKVEALTAQVAKLEKKVEDQKVEFTAASLNAESKELCLAAKAKPCFEKPLAQLLALIPPEAEVVLAEADDPEKVVKAPARKFFKTVLVAKGTAKLEDPVELTKPPKQKKVQQFAIPKTGLPDDEGALAELNTKARELSLAEGISIGEAQAKVLTEYRKEQKEA